ncbi:MAG: hypothetical protein VYE22_06110 [Myxococcota bacterium]|nr:hypothetical protein [Myxococcota bacterium]
MRRWLTTLALGCILGGVNGCGGATPAARTAPTAEASIDPPAFLERVGAESTALLQRPSASLDELEAARTEARGQDRRQATRDLVVGLMFAAQDAEGREARRHRRRADRFATATVRGSRDRNLHAEIAFVKMWMAWQSGARSAGRLAERFTERHTQSGQLVALAWMVRGEIAFAEERHEDAIAAWRFAFGQLGTPLYAYALYRTAAARQALGQPDEAEQALAEVEQLGCDAEAHAEIRRVAVAAASENGRGLRLDVDGVTRPAACPVPTEEDEEEDEGWRPAE